MMYNFSRYSMLSIVICFSSLSSANAETDKPTGHPFWQSPNIGGSNHIMGKQHTQTTDDTHTEKSAGLIKQGKVLEVNHGEEFSYLLIDTDNQKIWIAGIKVAANTGDTISYTESVTMSNFKSTTLARTFSQIIFVSDVKVVK